MTRARVKRVLHRQLGNFVALVALMTVSIACGLYLIDHQNAEFPSWMPIIGDDPYVVHAQMSTAQGVIPGQGQLVEVAGVIVGRVDDARLQNGRAVLDIHLERGKAKLFRNATILMRPRTLLKDMILQVTPGTPTAGRLRDGDVIPVSSTLPDVNLDELLASLDTNTRDALIALVQGAGQGLRDQGDELASVFRRFDPTMRELRRINDQMIGRRHAIRRLVTNFSKISTTLAAHRSDLTEFVRSSSRVFGALADEQAGVRATLAQLPGTLQEVRASTQALTPVARSLGSASQKLLPGARSLGAGAQALDAMFSGTRTAVATQLRPMARATRAPLADLRRAVDRMSSTSTAAHGGLHDLNRFFNDFAHQPPGQRAQSFVFWAAWSAHQINSVVSGQDALGPFAHTMTVMTCSSLGLLPGFIRSDPALALAVSLANFPTQEQVCR